MIKKLGQPFKTDPYDRPNDEFQKIQIAVEDRDNFDAENQVQTSNLRFSRRRFTFAVTAFILGAVVILIESPARNEFLAPGPLSSQHAQLLAGQGTERCAACHDSGNQSLSQWLTRAFSKDNNAAACQSDLCMKCHEKSINVEFATKPHNLDPQELQKRSQKFQLASYQNGFSPPIDHNGDVECGTCHKEHHGNSDLKMLTDRQCQTCHSQKFYSFENDHPDFVGWPQKRRQRIAFDHVTHFYKHFPGKEQSFDCKACHVDDQFQSVKLLASYKQTCAQCHDKDIQGASESGLSLVSLPMLDLDVIRDQALDPGEWPEGATGDFDGKIPELMRLLLFKDDRARRILEERDKNFEFGDFDPDNPDDVKDAVDLAWATKNLVYDLATGGKIEIRKRLEFALQRTLSETDYLALTNGIDANVFAAAANKWLPNLAHEIPDYRASHTDLAELYRSQGILGYFSDEDPGLLATNPLQDLFNAPIITDTGTRESVGSTTGEAPSGVVMESTTEKNPVHEQTNDGNWLTSEPEIVSELVPKSSSQNVIPKSESHLQGGQTIAAPKEIPEEELLAKNPIAGLGLNTERIEDSSSNSQLPFVANNSVGKQKLNTETINEVNRPKIQSNNPSQLNAARTSQARALSKRSDIPESELLAKNPLNSIEDENARTSTEPIVINDSLEVEAQPGFDHSAEFEQEQQIAEEFIDKVAQAKQDELFNAGSFDISDARNSDEKYVGTHGRTGWFRNDQLFQISYRVNGHADRFMTTVMDVIAETPEASDNPATSPFFGQMTSKAAVGACIQCHTVDSKENSTHKLNWVTMYRDPLYRDFTRFSHRPHLTQPQLRDCTACHTLDDQNSNAHTFVHFDSNDVLSNFKAITKVNCTSCHFKGSTNSGCTQCHNYHVGSKVFISQ